MSLSRTWACNKWHIIVLDKKLRSLTTTDVKQISLTPGLDIKQNQMSWPISVTLGQLNWFQGDLVDVKELSVSSVTQTCAWCQAQVIDIKQISLIKPDELIYLVLDLFSTLLCVKKHDFCGLFKKNCKIICSSEFNFCTNFPVKNGKTSYWRAKIVLAGRLRINQILI